MSTIGKGCKPMVACFYIGITGISRYDDGVICFCYEEGHNHITDAVRKRTLKEYGKYTDK